MDYPVPTELQALLQQLAAAGQSGEVARRLELCEQALELVDQDHQPRLWAALQLEMSDCLTACPWGDRRGNLERSIGHCRQALKVYTREASPVHWAMVQNNLGNAYAARLQGKRAENLEQAIEHYEQALEIPSYQASPELWATTQDNLGNAYRDRLRGGRAGNLEGAIGCYSQALRVFTRQDFPVDWAMTQNNLGITYAERIAGDRSENLERAIENFRQALQVYTLQAFPVDWALTQNNLGNTYRRRIRGDRGGNIERAIGHHELALQILTCQDFPTDWAMAQNNLGNAYRSRFRGDQGENLEQAIEHYEQALKVYTREAFPGDWAMIQNNLAAIYRDCSQGDRGQNLELAIKHFQQALRVYTRQAYPADWAMVQCNLGATYRMCFHGDRGENLQRALEHSRQALRVYTRQAFPVEWATIQHNLANIYRERIHCNREENIQQAIHYYWQALDIFTPRAFSANCHRVASSLGELLFDERRWPEAVTPLNLALRAAQNLYEACLLRDSQEGEIAEMGDLHHLAAYALARAGDPRHAALTLEQGRARRLSEALARDRTDLESVRLQAPGLYAAYHETTEKLQALEALVEETGRTLSEGWPPLTREEWGRQAEQLHIQLSAAVDGIRCLSGFEGFLKQAEFDDITQAAGANEALVYLATTPAGSFAILLFRAFCSEGVTCEAIWADAFAQSDLKRLLLELEQGESAGGYLQGQQDTSLLKLCLEKLLPILENQLVGPVATRLAELGLYRVLLIPCGQLGLLPLHAAFCGPNGDAFHLVEQFTISYAPSARTLPVPLSDKTEQAIPVTFAGAGNPLPTSYRPLPFARAELEEVAGFFDNSRTLLGEAATKAALLEALDGATHVHLSCHGAFRAHSPLDSKLLLAHDQALTLRDLLYGEANGLLRQARLVVLSACQSAIVEFARLPDEVISLQAGFLQAGARSVIGTLWPVEDVSTSLLMAKFYEYHLVGDVAANDLPMVPAQALARAQNWLQTVTARELRRHYWRLRRHGPSESESVAVQGIIRFSLMDPESRPFARPYYWASFVLLGR